MRIARQINHEVVDQPWAAITTLARPAPVTLPSTVLLPTMTMVASSMAPVGCTACCTRKPTARPPSVPNKPPAPAAPASSG